MVDSETYVNLLVGSFLIIWHLIVVVFILGHTIKPGTPEHGTTEHGTPKDSGTPRNNRIQNTCGTVEHLRKVAEQRNISGTPRNTNVTPAEHRGTTEPFKAKNNGSVV